MSLQCSDLVDYRENIYIKKVSVKNLSDSEREIRVFFAHDFHILESPTADTAYYDPDEKAIIHYKGNRYFLMSGLRAKEYTIDQYATGIKEFHGLEGTWKDAEDGILEKAPISQGSVDSALSFTITIGPSSEETLYYWMTVGRDHKEVKDLNRMLVQHGPDHFIHRTSSYWKAWVRKEGFNLGNLPQAVTDLYIRLSAKLYENLVDPCGNFLVSYRDRKTGLPFPCHDLWEEKWGIHTFTVSTVYAGLKAAENFAYFFW